MVHCNYSDLPSSNGGVNHHRDDFFRRKMSTVSSATSTTTATATARKQRMGHVSRLFYRGLIEYETPRLVKVHNMKLGLVVRLTQILVITYVICFALIYDKGYQEFAPVESSVTVKVKGTSRSRLPDSVALASFLPYVNYSSYANDKSAPATVDWRSIYNRVWDEADYVIPPAENGAFFITTNVIITPNQMQGRCPESGSVSKSSCWNDADCRWGDYLEFGHGPMTGRCVKVEEWSRRSRLDSGSLPGGLCEIESWCPVENDELSKALYKNRPIMDRVDTYTVFIKNSITFPFFGPKYHRNNVIPGPDPSMYHPTERPLGQIFRIGDMVRMAEGNFTLLSLKGGVISISIKWRCNLDFNFERHCLPKYEFRVLDTGWNFRHALFHEHDRRTLFKAYGLRFVITVDGRAGKFSLRNTVLNVGNGLALLGVTTVIGEFFLLHFVKEKKNIAERKYDYVSIRRHALPVLVGSVDDVAVAPVSVVRVKAEAVAGRGVDWKEVKEEFANKAEGDAVKV